jgi:hypothetical protein
MAKRKQGRSLTTVLFLLWAPTIVGALWIGMIADKWIAGTITGAIIGFVIGLGLASFPDLDRGGPDDSPDPFH